MSPPHPACPNDACSSRGAATHATWRKGRFVRRDRRVIARFQCRRCGRHFSTQTGSPTWRRRRCDVDEPLQRLLRAGASLRAAARLLGVNRKTVERRKPRPGAPAAPGPSDGEAPQPLS